MSFARIRKPVFVVLSLLLALTVLSFAPQSAAPASGGNTIALKAPSFVKVANAQEGPDATPMGFPQDEAGISAYFKSPSPIALADVRSVYRVIEAETADYIIGSVPVPDWWEAYDVHLYVHRDGWFLAYYLSGDPVGKIIDWKQYTGSGIPTKLETVLQLAANTAGSGFPGASFYDFRYPSATHLMIVAEDTDNGNSMQIWLPGTYTFYARSWSLRSYTVGCCYHGATYKLDGVTISTHGEGDKATEGNLTAGQLLLDSDHTISIEVASGTRGIGALALVYRVP